MSRSLLTFLLALCCATQLDQAAAQGIASGQLLYVDRELTFEDGFTGVETERPVPNAVVRVFDATDGAILGAGLTDFDGNFSLAVAGSGPRDVIVRGFCVSGTYGANRVLVETVDGVVYSTSSPTLSIPDLATTFDVGQLIAPKVTASGFVGSPFNLLDQGVRAMEYVTDQGAGGLPETIRIQWPELFSFAIYNVAHLSGDDGFDDIVALHEIGHVIHKLYSDSDSAGGGHTLGQSNQDPSISLGEGWASFFAGAVRQHQGLSNPGFYLDCDGDGSTGPAGIQIHMRFEDGAPFAQLTGGEADEGAVFCALWDLIDRHDTDDGFPGDDDLLDGTIDLAPGLDGDQAQWQAFTGPVVVSSPYLHVIELWNGLFLDAGADRYAELSAAFAAWKIRVEEDLFEPNDTTAQATPLVPGKAWSPTLTLYASDLDPPVPGGGDVDVFRVDLFAGQVIEIETRYPSGAADHETYCDTRLALFAPDGSLVASSLDGGAGDNAKLAGLVIEQSGPHAIHVAAESSLKATGSYEIRAVVLSPPAITGLSPTSVQTLLVGASPTIVVDGVDIGNATSVTIGGAQVESFVAVGLDRLEIHGANYVQLGLQDLVVTTPLGSASTPISVTTPAAPLLNVADGAPFWNSITPIAARVAAEPGDLAFLFVSLSDQPTAVPGVLDLDIGGGLSGLFQVALLVGNGAGLASYPIPVASLPAQVPFHLQAGVLPSATLALPLLASNAVQGAKSF
ncbi:hypothetical protein [Engelhardtia mirabilis]|uniref:Uncharacterized protein n=1 Tax=Engelhardtia mirabilis TaxID=2528011 RepID=A0A518BSN4_9BACT|nr:hypothetical protein Pla133_51050 [Planctomycetes bacterium Pla133]QDV04307.1 hypothetical protein Pla86_51020 [Planctomycetes bacterium Pla86]